MSVDKVTIRIVALRFVDEDAAEGGGESSWVRRGQAFVAE